MDNINYQRKPIKNFEGYEVDTNGNIWSCKRNNVWRKIRLFQDKDGYLQCNLSVNGFRKRHKVHRIVAEAFVLNPHSHPLVCHKNDIPHDNRVENLYWGTAKENSRDCVLSGAIISGERHPNAKLRLKYVNIIRQASDFGIPPMKIAKIGSKILGVHTSVILKVIKNKLWKSSSKFNIL